MNFTFNIGELLALGAALLYVGGSLESLRRKESADRVESLDYRWRQHLARWPGLAEVATP